MPVSPSVDSSPPSVWPRPTCRREWWRWPIAWGIAVCASLGLLACLASVIPSGIRLVPLRLLAALQIPLAPPTARVAMAGQTPAMATKRVTGTSADRPANPAPSMAPPSQAVQPAAVSPAPADITVPAAPEADGSLHPAAPGTASPTAGAGDQDGRLQADTTDIARLPPAQRCPVHPAPAFPQRARDDGIEHGYVLARLLLDAQGSVREVTILESRPRGYFEAETRRVTLQWHCLANSGGNEAVRVPFKFNLQ